MLTFLFIQCTENYTHNCNTKCILVNIGMTQIYFMYTYVQYFGAQVDQTSSYLNPVVAGLVSGNGFAPQVLSPSAPVFIYIFLCCSILLWFLKPELISGPFLLNKRSVRLYTQNLECVHSISVWIAHTRIFVNRHVFDTTCVHHSVVFGLHRRVL